MGTPTPISCSLHLQSNTVYKMTSNHALLSAPPPPRLIALIAHLNQEKTVHKVLKNIFK